MVETRLEFKLEDKEASALSNVALAVSRISKACDSVDKFCNSKDAVKYLDQIFDQYDKAMPIAIQTLKNARQEAMEIHNKIYPVETIQK